MLLDDEQPRGNSSKTGNFETDASKVQLMAGIFLVSSLLACLVMATLVTNQEETSQNLAEEKTREGEMITRGESVAGKHLLITATVRQMTKRDQLLLIPITLWCGVEQGFFGADFTAVRNVSLFSCQGQLYTYPCQTFLKTQAQIIQLLPIASGIIDKYLL